MRTHSNDGRRAAWCIGLLVVLGAGAAPAQQWCAPQRADTGYTAYVGATVWDGTGAPARAGTTILVHGARIAAVYLDGAQPTPAGARTRDLSGRFVIPGLIDTHVHVATDVSGEDRRPRTELRLCRALMGGVTAARDMAGDTRALGSLARDAKVGDIASPDLYYAALWAGPDFFKDPRTALASAGEVPGSMPGMRAVDSTTDLRLAVAEAKGTGATAIKLYAALTPRVVAAIVPEAHRQGLLVWAHAAMAEVSPLQLTESGVDVLSHGTLVAWQVGRQRFAAWRADSTADPVALLAVPAFDSLLTAMRARGSILEPTLFVYSGDPARVRALAAAVARRALAAGVELAAGTDSLGSGDPGGWLPPNLDEELELLVGQAGLSPVQALTAATRNAARVVGAETEQGTVSPGKLADFVVLDADPLAAIGNVRRVRLVVKRGAAYAGGPTIAR